MVAGLRLAALVALACVTSCEGDESERFLRQIAQQEALPRQRRRCWLLYEPSASMGLTGGLLLLHDLAHTLLGLGKCVRMFHVRDAFAHFVSTDARVVRAVNMTLEDYDRFYRPLGPGDTTIATEANKDLASGMVGYNIRDGPESRFFTTSETVRAVVELMEEDGGMVARYCMAYQPSLGAAVEPSVQVHLGITDYLHRVFAGSGPWIEAALGTNGGPGGVHEAARAWAAAADPFATKRRGPDGLERVVVFDDDMPELDADHFTAALGAAAAARGLALRIRAVEFSGYSGEARLDLFRAASVYVDANLLGLENGVSEFGAFGAVPMIAHAFLGSEHPSFFPRVPQPVSSYAYDRGGVEALAEAVVDVVAALDATPDAYAAVFRYFDDYRAWAPETIRADFVATWRRYATSREVVWVLVLEDEGDWAVAAPFATSVLARYAFSKVLILCPHPADASAVSQVGTKMYEFLFGQPAKLALERLGVWRRIIFIFKEETVLPFDSAAPAAAETALRVLANAFDSVALVNARRATAPAPAAVDEAVAATPPGACGLQDNLLLCHRAPDDDGDDPPVYDGVVALLEADAPPDDDCAALRRHGLFAQVAPLFTSANLNALDAACAGPKSPASHGRYLREPNGAPGPASHDRRAY